jgi:transcriptional regulator of arginine metabolism
MFLMKTTGAGSDKVHKICTGIEKCIKLQNICINIQILVKNRNERLMEIRRLIAGRNISSQEELMKLLEEKGFELTQATLSRDLKYLKVGKMPDDRSGYVYILPERDQYLEQPEVEDRGFNGLISIDFAQGMAILRTLPGHAGSIAYAIDNLDAYEIAGTIAGDDTILLIPRDGVTRSDLVKLLSIRIPGMVGELTRL